MREVKFKRNESFYIRDGWFQKALHALDINDENVFSGIKGVDYLGIGANMVKSLKYWLFVSNIITLESKSYKLTEFGRLLLEYDPYLENNFTWFLIHYYICQRKEDAPIFNYFFNSNITRFEKSELIKTMYELISNDYPNQSIKNNYLSDDIGVFLKTYVVEDHDGNPEDNYISPLSNLELLEKKKDVYIRKKARYSKLSYLIVYYALTQQYEESFNIEDSFMDNNSPIRLFNLDKNSFMQYLEEMKRRELINVNKTAGLNTVYFVAKKDLAEIFSTYFEE